MESAGEIGVYMGVSSERFSVLCALWFFYFFLVLYCRPNCSNDYSESAHSRLGGSSSRV